MKDKIIAGRKPVLEFVQRNAPIDSVYILKSIRGEFEKELRRACKVLKIPYKTVPKSFFDKYRSFNHQGVLAMKPLTKYYTMDEFFDTHEPLGIEWFVLLLEGITDVRNLGAIARSAEVLGVDALILPSKNSAAINMDSFKTSAGAIGIIPIIRETNVSAALRKLKERQFTVYGTYMNAKEKLREISFSGSVALVMGSEEKGISSETYKLLDHGIIIPQLGKTDSLNVSVATGICLYEFLNKRQL